MIARLCELLRRAGGRGREDDAPHRLEGVAVVVFDPLTGTIRPDLPPPGIGLTWKEAVGALVATYVERFPPDDLSLMAASGGAAAEADEQLAEEELSLADEEVD